MAEAKIGQRYRHKKGGRYEVTGLGKHSETHEDVVIYKSLDHGTTWVRPKDIFESPGRFEFEEEDPYETMLRVARELDQLLDIDSDDQGELSNARSALFAICERHFGDG